MTEKFNCASGSRPNPGTASAPQCLESRKARLNTVVNVANRQAAQGSTMDQFIFITLIKRLALYAKNVAINIGCAKNAAKVSTLKRSRSMRGTKVAEVCAAKYCYANHKANARLPLQHGNDSHIE